MAKRPQAQLNPQEQSARPAWLARLPLLLGGLVLVALVASAMMWLLNPRHLPLRSVRVEGKLVHVTPAEIRTAVAPYAKQGFLHVDIAAVRNALEQVPWIYSAQVTRSWPDALLVTVQEQKVLARWAGGGLVNVEGEVFRPPQPFAAPNLPLFQGPSGTSTLLAAQYADLQRALAPLAMKITQVKVDERRSWSLTLANGVQLMLGRSDHAARLARFIFAYPQVLQSRIATVARVDLRYTNGFAVQWRDQPADPSGHAGA